MRRDTGRWMLVVLCAAVCAGTAGCRINPVTGSREVVLLGRQDEIALGHQTHPNVIFMYDGEYHDPELNRYLGTIVMRLHRCSHRHDTPMEFTMLNTSVVNAFATPAHVYATRGFLARLENEAQFAAVMGHELAHVAAGHSAKKLSNSLLTGLALGAAETVMGDSTTGQVAVGLGEVSVALLGLSYSREQERQADRVGTYYMALAGWDARQAIAMQRLLASLSSHRATVLDRYLTTHPPAADRIAEIENIIGEKNLVSARYIQGDGVFASRWDRRLERLREVNQTFAPYDRGMKLLANKKFAEALSAANESIGMRPDQAQFHRLKGDALLALGRSAEAQGAYLESLARDPRYVPSNIGLGLVFLEQAKFSAAEKEFAVAAHGFPGSVAAWYGLGMARYKLGRYADAIKPLERAASALPKDPDVHYALAVCYDNTGQPEKAYRSYRRALGAGLSGPEKQEALERVRVLQPSVAPSP